MIGFVCLTLSLLAVCAVVFNPTLTDRQRLSLYQAAYILLNLAYFFKGN